jgi:hypothetical protein
MTNVAFDLTVGDATRAAGTFETTIIYPAFTPAKFYAGIVPHHTIFAAQGMPVWPNNGLYFPHTPSHHHQ